MVNGQVFGPVQPPTATTGEGPTKKDKCEARGGRWDEANQTCIMPTAQETQAKETAAEEARLTKIQQENLLKQQEKERAEITGPETFTDPLTGRASGIVTPGGTFLGLTPEDVETVARGEAARVARPEGTAPVGTAQEQLQQQQEAQRLTGQIGEFAQLPLSQFDLDLQEGLIVGARQGIPRAITIAGAAIAGGAAVGAGVGALGGPAAPVTVPTGAIIGGALGFLGSISGSIISNFQSQRTDTTTSQQRVLDEGKQTMQDWATQAAADPSNRAFYLGEYNKQSALIDRAHRQMKQDTDQDLAKFETALPNLAEFETFYSSGGERDVLDSDMQLALVGALPQETIDFRMQEMANRRLV